MLTEAVVIDQFRAAMAEHGIMVADAIVADGAFHRIHVEGDAKGVRNGFYVLHFDERPAGLFGCNKRFGNGTKFKWSAKGAAPMSQAERDAFRKKSAALRAEKAEVERERRAAAVVRASQLWGAATDAVEHPYLARKAVKAYGGIRVGVWSRVDRDTGETSIVSNHALLIPIRDEKKKIHSLQAIFPKASHGRDKDFLRDGAKEGLFFSFGKPAPTLVKGALQPVIVIGEGYATLATVHEATGHACIVAFDCGNIMPVARKIRARYPDACIVVAADNDQWTTLTPIKNPGLTSANAVARAVGALVAVPPFTSADSTGKDDSGRPRGPTDFNDLAALQGLDFVRSVFERTLNPAPVADEAPPWESEVSEGDEAPDEIDDWDSSDLSLNRNFTVLGYNRGVYYVFQHGKQQIINLTRSDFGSVGLIELAPLQWWETHFPGEKTKIDSNAAAEFIIRTAEKRGIYDPSKVRGRGAWLDERRVIYHHGDYLSVDGEAMPINKVQTRHVYELDRSLPSPHKEALSDEDGIKLLTLAEAFRWSKPGSAALMAGWVALAPMCGALRWRPHIWLSGGPGCGKSTIHNHYIHHLLGGLDVYAQGNSSEAGIRQRLKADALPVLFDESEANEEADARRMQSVISLIRQASTESEATTLKGSAGGQSISYHVRSMFCLASIQVALKQQADVERLSVLTLRSKSEDINSADTWERLSDSLYAMKRDVELPAKLFRRSMDLLPITLANIAIFSHVAGKKFNNQRDGDQYGTLLAGAWSLISKEPITATEALAWIESYDWSEHRDKNDTDDAQKALAALMEAHVRAKGVELAVYELVRAAYGKPSLFSDVNKESADALLQRHGMRVSGDWLILSNNSNALKGLMTGTTFEADYRGVLLRVKGADRNDNRPIRINGVQSKCIRVPLPPLFEDEPALKPLPF